MTRATALLHIAKKDLCLEDDDYRDILERTTGQRSAKGLSEKQATAALDEFKRLGFQPRIVGGNPTVKKPALNANFDGAKKCTALWISLFQLGVVRDSSNRALNTFAARQLGVDAFAWADQQEVYKVTEALKAMAERNGWKLKGVATLQEQKQNLVIAQCMTLKQPEPVGLLNMTNAELTELSRKLGRDIQRIK